MIRKSSTVFVLLLLSSFLSSIKVSAEANYNAWTTNGLLLNNSATSTFISDPKHVADGFGGIIVSWRDNRSGNQDIYAQRYTRDGTALWTAGGVVISNPTGDQLSPVIISDEVGGAIIAWDDRRSGTADVYAQRVDAAGAVSWTANGVVVSNPTGAQTNVRITTDWHNGAIITWDDARAGVRDVYAQRIDGSGNAVWTANGVAIGSGTGVQFEPAITTGNYDEAIIGWADSRSGTTDIYAQKVNISGVALWTANGAAVTTATQGQDTTRITSDNAGGAIVGWADFRNGTDYEAYAQRMDSTGTPLWTANGELISTGSGTQKFDHILMPDTTSVMYLINDARYSPDIAYFVQKTNLSGTVQFVTNGVEIIRGSLQANHSVADGRGGVLFVWMDFRGNLITNLDLYAQHIDTSGNLSWAPGGSLISAAVQSQSNPFITRTDNGEFIVTWQDTRSGTKGDLYGMKLLTVSRSNITRFSNQMSRINETTVANHDIRFRTSNGITAKDTIKISFPVDFTFGGTFDFNEVSVQVATTSDCVAASYGTRTVAATPSNTDWGVAYSSNVITITAPNLNTNGTQVVTAGNCMRVLLTSSGGSDIVTNPTVTSDTVYRITIEAAQERGEAAVIILNDAGTPDSDQIRISAEMGTSLFLDLDTVLTNCNNNTETGLNAVNLGLLNPGTVRRSDTTINFVCIDAGTSAGAGINLFALSNRNNAVGGLVSGANVIPSATANLNSAGSGYGIRVASVGTPALGTLNAISPFNSVTAGDVGALPGLLGSAAMIVDSSGPVQTGTSSRIAVEVAAKASTSTVPGVYTDIITFRALVNF